MSVIVRLTPNMALKSGSLNLKGILDTCSLLGWFLLISAADCSAVTPDVAGTIWFACVLPGTVPSTVVPAADTGVPPFVVPETPPPPDATPDSGSVCCNTPVSSGHSYNIHQHWIHKDTHEYKYEETER